MYKLLTYGPLIDKRWGEKKKRKEKINWKDKRLRRKNVKGRRKNDDNDGDEREDEK